jgi:adenosylcobinamide kinase / adenosylcobinamide-phosphate guanylyltransferase
LTGDRDLHRRVLAHRERRPAEWGTLEVGDELARIHAEAERWQAVLLDSLTLWVSARMARGEDEAGILGEFDLFLRRLEPVNTPFVLVSDEVGMGVVPESEAGRLFRDLLGLVNQRAAATAEEVYLCVAGLPVRIK